MKNHVLALAAAFMVVCIIGVVSSSSHALDCNGAPPSWADTSAYESWCTRCGGFVSGSGPRIQCKPGPNWGRTGSSSSSGGSGAAGVLYQPFYNLGYGIGQSIGSALFGDAAEDARRAAEQARATQNAEAETAARRAEDTRKRQETYNRLSSQLQLSGGFDGGNGSGLDLMLGDGSDGLRPQGTSFFGMGGGSGTVDAQPRQGYSATARAEATLPLLLGDPNEATNIASNVVDLRDKKDPYAVNPRTGGGGTEPSLSQRVARLEQLELEKSGVDWTKRQTELIEQRLTEPNKWARGIYDSLKTQAPPLPYKRFDELHPGDTLLIAGSNVITKTDNMLSGDNKSHASHTVLYLKEVNGTKLFLDNQPNEGVRIIPEDYLLRKYGSRAVEVAKLAQPLDNEEAERLYTAARELRARNIRKLESNNWFDKTNYGIWNKDNVVCSEADWALLKAAGRGIPKTDNQIKGLLGIDFSPADFYTHQQYFLISPLAMPRN